MKTKKDLKGEKKIRNELYDMGYKQANIDFEGDKEIKRRKDILKMSFSGYLGFLLGGILILNRCINVFFSFSVIIILLIILGVFSLKWKNKYKKKDLKKN